MLLKGDPFHREEIGVGLHRKEKPREGVIFPDQPNGCAREEGGPGTSGKGSASRIGGVGGPLHPGWARLGSRKSPIDLQKRGR